MAGPWEKYQQQSKPEGPWAKYAAADEQNRPPASEDESLTSQIGHGLLRGVSKVANTIDSYGGAPTRSALGALQEGKGLLGAAKSFGHQFGGNPEEAPTGKELASKAGLSREETINTHLPYIGKVSPAGMAGTAIDIAADPLNFLPVGKVLQGATKGMEMGAKALAKPIEKVVEGAANAGRYRAYSRE